MSDSTNLADLLALNLHNFEDEVYFYMHMWLLVCFSSVYVICMFCVLCMLLWIIFVVYSYLSVLVYLCHCTCMFMTACVYVPMPMYMYCACSHSTCAHNSTCLLYLCVF